MRSWVIASYAASVVASTAAVVHDLDYWGYHTIWNDEASLSVDPTCVYCDPNIADPTCVPTQNFPCFDPVRHRRNYDVTSIYFLDMRQGFTSICSLAVRIFILKPFSFVLIGWEIRFFLWLQQKSRLTYWWSAAFALPIFLVLECVFEWRSQLFFLLNNLASLAVGSNNVNVSMYSFSAYAGQNPYDHNSDSLSFVSSIQAPEEGSGSFSGVRRWDPDADWDVMWWPITIRPFWGIFYLVQHYSGGCLYEWGKRPGTSDRTDIHRYQCANNPPSAEWKAADHGDCVQCKNYEVSDLLHDENPRGHWNTSYYISVPWTYGYTALIWFCAILPMAAVLYYVHEPPRWRGSRLKIWHSLTGIKINTKPHRLNLDHESSDEEDEAAGQANLSSDQAILKEISAISSNSGSSASSKISTIMNEI